MYGGELEIFDILMEKCTVSIPSDVIDQRNEAFERMNIILKSICVTGEDFERLEDAVNGALASSDLVSFIKGFRTAEKIL